MAKMTEDELKALVDAEVRQSVGYYGGKLAAMRQKAEEYYLGQPKGDLTPPEIEGRSNVVETVVRDTIEGMVPSLMRTFCAGDNVVEFTPQKEEDEQNAKDATDYVNHVFYKQNQGYNILQTAVRDGLLQKCGIIKVWWDTRNDESREEYEGLSDQQLAMLLQDKEIEPIEHKAYPDPDAQAEKEKQLPQMQQALQQMQQQAAQMPPQPPQQQPPQPGQPPNPGDQLQQQMQQLQQQMAQPVPQLHDVTVKRRMGKGRICIEPVPPEEFMISRKAKSIQDAPFVAHRVMRTISELTSMGYKDLDNITSDDNAAMMNGEHIARVSFDDDTPMQHNDNVSMDKSQRIVWLTECYMKVDFDGDGIAEWRKVTKAGNEILDNEECSGPPFAALIPMPLPHRFHGLSIADLGGDAQKIKTQILRARLDNLFLQVNGRYFAVEGQVNLDDLLTSRPGGVVRMKQAGMAGRLDQGMTDTGDAVAMQEYMREFTESATGWNRNSMGTNADALQNTATGANIATNKSDMRVELIARNLAEGGITDMCRLILKIVVQKEKDIKFKVGSVWRTIDPREWRNQFDMTIGVGLGTGNKDQQIGHLHALMQVQGTGLNIGITKPENMYNAASKLAEAMGFRTPDIFFTDPKNTPPKPPPPDPAMQKAQMDQQMADKKMQMDHAHNQELIQMDMQKHQIEMQQEQQAKEQQMQVDQHRNEVEAQQDQLRFQHEKELKAMELEAADRTEQRRIENDRWKAQLQAETTLMAAEISAKVALNAQQMTAADIAVDGE